MLIKRSFSLGISLILRQTTQVPQWFGIDKYVCHTNETPTPYLSIHWTSKEYMTYIFILGLAGGTDGDATCIPLLSKALIVGIQFKFAFHIKQLTFRGTS